MDIFVSKALVAPKYLCEMLHSYPLKKKTVAHFIESEDKVFIVKMQPLPAYSIPQ